MLVSVLVPVYNGEKHVAEAVKSILNQTHTNLEVIIINDGSTDNTLREVSGIADARIKIVDQSNAGLAAARNRGLKLATGDVIALLDHDDVWFEHKLERQLALLRSDATIGAVGSLLQYLGDDGPIDAVSGEIADNQRERIAAAKLMPFAPSSMIVTMAVIREIGGFDEALFPFAGPVDDLDFLSRVATVSRVVTVAEPLGYYRVHSGASSFTHFFQVQDGTRFLQARRLALTKGKDLKWEEWLESSRPSFRVRQKDRARFLFRVAGMHFTNGKKMQFLSALAGASILDPKYTLQRVLRQRKK